MDLIEYTTEWVKGEVFQGKIMLLMGVALLLAAFAIFRSEHELLRGMLIPLGLIVLLLIGYGGMQVTVRPGHISKVSATLAESQEKALDIEYQKALKDNKAYSTLKPIWAGLIILSVVGYFLFSQVYFKGLAIGGVVLFVTFLIVDSTLHYRLNNYLKELVALAAG